MSPDFSKIGYYDLKLEARNLRLPKVVGLQKETARLNRILARDLQHNAIVCAPSGCGKTALVGAWALQALENPLFGGKKIAMLDSGSLQKIGQLPQSSLAGYQEAFLSLSNCVLIIDSFGEMIYQSLGSLQNWNTLLKPLFFKPDVNIILNTQPEELKWLRDNKSHLSHFEVLKLETQKTEELREILNQAAKKTGGRVGIDADALDLMLRLCERFPSLGQLPKSALQLLDESLAEIKSLPGALSHRLTRAVVEKIASEKTGVPTGRLAEDDKTMLKNLPDILQSKIIGQKSALLKMASVIQRARLGLRGQTRPLGSFLLLGPSGVGKTETAKILAETLYGSASSFLRIDMSEFGESHSAARLLGSPAGYVGFEAGGQLTNHFKNHPYSLLLLDEIEKAHPKIFDIFLQILDDGRVTSGGGETADLTQSIIMATSNLAVQKILDAFAENPEAGDEDFLKNSVMPELLKHFRPEFLNRFDSILIYKPLSLEDLTDIALLEVGKIEARTKAHNIKFAVTREALRDKIIALADPRFGARPVKRFVEEACENLITRALLK